jgi:hypothetical protein
LRSASPKNLKIIPVVVDIVATIMPNEEDPTMDAEHALAYQMVRRWIKNYSGYQQGHRTKNLVPKAENIAKKHHYLRTLFANRKLPEEERRREVYTNESYIHHHYRWKDDSIWDPNDHQDVVTSKDKYKGSRYCFCAAIQGPNPRVNPPVLNIDKAGLVPNSLWEFCPQKASDHDGDYHKVFHGENYVHWWWTKLLPNLKQPSLIILDNAKYHLVYGEHVPKWSKMKKAECVAFLQSKQVVYDLGTSAVELKQEVKRYVERNEKPEIIRLAEIAGHEVLFTPPYYSDLQPIELAWAYVKGAVGQQYSVGTTLQIVHTRLLNEFTRLEGDHKAVAGMIRGCTERAHILFQEMELEDDDDLAEEEELDDASSDEEDGHGAPLDELDQIELFPDGHNPV